MPGRGIAAGTSAPLGATVSPHGVNFSLYCRSGSLVELLLFDRVDDPAPKEIIALDPSRNRTFHYWHIHVHGLLAGQLYGYRVHGASDPERGLRLDSARSCWIRMAVPLPSPSAIAVFPHLAPSRAAIVP